MRYKASKYNVVIEKDNKKGVLIANTYSSKISWIPKEVYDGLYASEVVCERLLIGNL